MDTLKSLCCILALALIGCSSTSAPITSSGTTSSDDASIKLAEAASSISGSLVELKAIEKAEAPPMKALPYPTSYDMQQTASVDWSGPIEPLLRRIAQLTNYHFQVLGVRPSVPVLVTVSAESTPLAYIIRDANFQAGSRASIFVYPAIRLIELRYTKL